MQLVNMRAYSGREGPSSTMTSVLTKRGNVDTDMHSKKMSCENEAEDHSDASTTQRIPKTASKTKHWVGETRGTRSPSRPQKEPTLPTPGLNFWPPELRDNAFVVQAPGCGNVLHQPQEITQGSLRKHRPSRDRNKKSPGKIRGKGAPRNWESRCGTPNRGCTEWVSG